jgi:asparagine synthase (glutamine-hydrolysing)
MCGVAGFLDSSRQTSSNKLQAKVTRMAETLRHRGPDDSGTWVDERSGIALGFRRLSIVDLSPEGHQPMLSACGRFVIVFNGEVYNFAALSQELKTLGHSFRGHSDTEVILASIRQWGLEPAVKKFVGMFAFALWDRDERTLHLVRDRLGIKPLYYGWAGNTFLFGSELKALRANPDFVPEIDRDAIVLQMRYNCIPQPHSIYRGIHKLPPGCTLTLRSECKVRSSLGQPIAYWSARKIAEQAAAEPFTGPDHEAIEQLDILLRDSVKLRMVGDVPLGAFLSGGIDSSTVVALMQAQSNRPVKTFTIGFYEKQYSEARRAKAVAMHLGTDHTELYVTPEETLAVIPKLPTLYDEPFSDSSQIPTYLISELARRQVTVSLSGDGGDELFGGYNRHFWGPRLWNRIGRVPRPFRRFGAGALRQLSPRAWKKAFSIADPFFPSRLKVESPGDQVHKLANVLPVKNPEEFYKVLVSHWKRPTDLVLGASEPPSAFNDIFQWDDLPDFSQKMMFLDLVTYLPDDILTKVDRASMGVSLEARVPVIDHRVVEFTARLPLNMKIRNGQGKWVLRQILYKYVPKTLLERPKMGFGMPISTWLRGPLRDWAESLLDERRLREEAILNPLPIRRKWAEHLSGKHNWQYELWDILMFEAWLEESRRTLLSQRAV